MRLACLLIFVASTAVAEDKPKLNAEAKALQGSWSLTGMLMNGADRLARIKEREKDPIVVIKGLSMSMGNSGGTASLVFGKSGKLKTLDMTMAPDMGGNRTIKAIYELKGDVLKICGPEKPTGDRPTKFDASEGTECVLMTLKRTKRKPAKKDAVKDKKSDAKP